MIQELKRAEKTILFIDEVHLLVNKATIRECANELGVSIKTSFFMRHRILDCLNIILGKGFVSGIVESDETYFRVSYKGHHSKGTNFVLPRKPHKRGGQKQGKNILPRTYISIMNFSINI